MQVYEVRFMRGDVYLVVASSESDAYKIVKTEHPECWTYDVLDIKVVEKPKKRKENTKQMLFKDNF